MVIFNKILDPGAETGFWSREIKKNRSRSRGFENRIGNLGSVGWSVCWSVRQFSSKGSESHTSLLLSKRRFLKIAGAILSNEPWTKTDGHRYVKNILPIYRKLIQEKKAHWNKTLRRKFNFGVTLCRLLTFSFLLRPSASTCLIKWLMELYISDSQFESVPFCKTYHDGLPHHHGLFFNFSLLPFQSKDDKAFC